MKTKLTTIFNLASATVLAILSIGMIPNYALACQYKAVSFNKDFEGGHLEQCKQLADNYFELSFTPENRPINSSPWYAFKIHSKTPKTLKLKLSFDGDAPRYLPKVSHDGVSWQNIPFEATKLSFIVDVDVKKAPIWIAGQEILDNDYYTQWLSNLNVSNTNLFELGKSSLGQNILALESKSAQSKEWLLLIGRQHPPEITGALAMRAFVDNILGDSKLAKGFRKRFNLLIVPNLNPDGVAAGHWRHNSQGIDLNRDWNKFEQQETKIVRDYLDSLIAKNHKLVMGLDFHSTKEDVFYTIPADAGVAPANLVNEWLEDVQQHSKNIFKVRIKPGNAPGRGIFKQFIADAYNVHGVTYEMGDSTNRDLIKQIAVISSELLMKRLTDTPAGDFYLKDNQ